MSRDSLISMFLIKAERMKKAQIEYEMSKTTEVRATFAMAAINAEADFDKYLKLVKDELSA